MVILARRVLFTQVVARPSLFPFLAGAVALAVYLLTLAPDISWAFQATDGPELITAAVTLGVPHPPGYPTYVLAGNLFSRILPGSLPLRFNLFSALAMAAAVVFVTAAAQQASARGRGSHVGAVVAALTLALLALTWQQALVAEVYALNLAVVACLLWALLSGRPEGLSGFLLGLALTTHPTSVLQLPLALGVTPRRHWPRLGAAAVLGLAPLLALPILAQQGSPLVWGEPQRLSGWWWLVSAELYRPNLFAVSPAEALARLGDWLWSAQLVVPALGALAAAPFLRQRHAGRRPGPSIWLAATAALYLVFAGFYRTPDAAVLLLPGLACAVLFMIPLFERLGPAGLALPALLLLLNFGQLNQSGDRSARQTAERILDQTPAGAILLTEGDATTFTLWYLHEVEALRPDVAVVDRHLLGFDWYREQLARRYDWMPIFPGYTPEALAHLGRPLCEVRLDQNPAHINC